MPRLTKRLIDSLKPRDRDYVVWDSDVKGFGARVRPSGRITYVLKYRVGGGRSGVARKPAIGAHGSITADQARAIARGWLAEVARGGDPGGQRKERRRAPTMAEVADRYLAEHVAEHNKPSTAREFKRLVQTRIKPAIGSLRVGDVSRQDVMNLHHAMRSTPRQVNQTLSVLSKMFGLCEAWGLRPDGSNPCRRVQRFRERKRERFLSTEELARLGAELAEAEATGTELPGAVAAIKLLAMTGCRTGEIVGLKWTRVDMERGVIDLADAKAGARPVGLGAAALAVLAGLERNSEWVIEAARGEPLAYQALARAWRRIRKRAGLGDARLHDLRHGFGTVAGGLGLNAFIIRDLLGHKTLAMSGRYVERDIDPLRTAADAVSGRIAAAMKGESAEVVELPRARR